MFSLGNSGKLLKLPYFDLRIYSSKKMLLKCFPKSIYLFIYLSVRPSIKEILNEKLVKLCKSHIEINDVDIFFLTNKLKGHIPVIYVHFMTSLQVDEHLSFGKGHGKCQTAGSLTARTICIYRM